MEATEVDILVLNYDGRALLAECLPSIVASAAASRHRCRVTVVDNSSADDPTVWLAAEFPTVAVRRMPNDGLASFNRIARELTSRVLVLLNNDIKLADDAIDPLVAPLLDSEEAADDDEPIFLTAPRCTLFDSVTHEGFQTSVVLRRGLVTATSLFAGSESIAHRSGPTASAGAALAVDRRIFCALGGFDPLYLPGRIEDLDFAFRGFSAGYRAVYVPESHAQHRGCATFGRVFGSSGSDRMALRNTLLFQWKHLRAFSHRAAYLAWLPLRIARDVIQAPTTAKADRFSFIRSYSEACAVWQAKAGDVRFQTARNAQAVAREREFFARHAPRRLLAGEMSAVEREAESARAAEEARRAENYPLARWYSRPAAGLLAEVLANSRVRPWQLTLIGFLCASSAAACSLTSPRLGLVAAALALLAWFFDRADGMLARRQGRSSPLGAWLDANVDEAVDLGLHVCMAAAAAAALQSSWPWVFLIAFLFGKYLLMYGLAAGETIFDAAAADSDRAANCDSTASASQSSLLRTLYHLPGNADVRIHLTALALATGLLTTELALIAVYYNFRWIARIALLVRRSQTRPKVRVVT
jgi:N-acetylglucosaminyl-diphospho-decaprenol L-rhamnosyltransferase